MYTRVKKSTSNSDVDTNGPEPGRKVPSPPQRSGSKPRSFRSNPIRLFFSVIWIYIERMLFKARRKCIFVVKSVTKQRESHLWSNQRELSVFCPPTSSHRWTECLWTESECRWIARGKDIIQKAIASSDSECRKIFCQKGY
jgi:hypothetical protein